MYSNNSDLIQIRDKLNSTLLPVTILLCFYTVFGLFGNIMLVVYYSYKIKRNPSFIFIVAMAISDLVVCCTSMPLEIVDVIEFYTFPNDVACKLLRTISYFAVSTSGLFLLAIAVDRYKNVCKPLQKQISTKQAKRIIIVIIVFVCFMVWPNLIFYDVKRINIDKDHGVMRSELNLTHAQSVIGYDCTTGSEYRLYVTIYHTILFLCFILTMFSLIVLYYQVVKEVIRMKNLRRHVTASEKQMSRKKVEHSSQKINKKHYKIRKYSVKELTESKYSGFDKFGLQVFSECSNISPSISIVAASQTSGICNPVLESNVSPDINNVADSQTSGICKPALGTNVSPDFNNVVDSHSTGVDNSALEMNPECSDNPHDINDCTDSRYTGISNPAFEMLPASSHDTKETKQYYGEGNTTPKESQQNSQQIYITVIYVYYPAICDSLIADFKRDNFGDNIENFGLGQRKNIVKLDEQTCCHENDKQFEAIRTNYGENDTNEIASIVDRNSNSKIYGPNRRQSQSNANRIHKKKFTFIALSITGAFIVSFLPYLSLMVWQTLSDDFMHLFGANLVVFEIFIRSWLLNSVVNPIIYGFFNYHFREFILSLLCRICCCRYIKILKNKK